MSAAPARPATRGLRQRPVFLLALVAVVGFLFANEWELFLLAIGFAWLMWLLDQ